MFCPNFETHQMLSCHKSGRGQWEETGDMTQEDKERRETKITSDIAVETENQWLTVNRVALAWTGTLNMIYLEKINK